MNDRLDQLESRAARLAAEIADLRRDLAGLRDQKETGSAGSRIDAFNAAVRGHEAPPESSIEREARGAADREPVRQGAGTGAGQQATPPAGSWDQVFKSLGVNPPPSGKSTSWLTPSKEGFENLIGRYGILALAVLTILMGVGAFIGWAVRNGMIGPEMRVAGGLVAAAAIAVLGWRMRQKADAGKRRFANILLALALAITHVVAWGAGPRLQLIPSTAALGLAALASAALAVVAWREDDQALFNVGFGGALLSPFVTSSESGNAILLLIFGGIVLGAGIAALGRRQWSKTPFVASLGVVAYAVVATDLVRNSARWEVANAPAIFALAVSILATLLLDGAKRMSITYLGLFSALGVLNVSADGPSYARPRLPLAILLLGATYFAGSPEHRGLRTSILSGILLPAGALIVALGATTGAGDLADTLTAAVFAALAGGAAWLNRDGERDTHAFTAAAIAGFAVVLAARREALEAMLLLAAFGVVCAWAARRYRLTGVGVAGLLWLAATSVACFIQLDSRSNYLYRPFLTRESLGAAALAVSWLFMSWHFSRYLVEGSTSETRKAISGVVRVLGGVFTFLWIREELAYAWSRDISGFLLAAYYAASGVAAIFLGRSRGIPLLRHAGLALCVVAAFSTILQSSTREIGWRVASYILVGVFLLAVAYWYRSTGRSSAEFERQTA